MDTDKTKRFFKLFLGIQPKLYAYIVFLVHNGDVAEDLLQDTAALIWGKFDEFQEDSNFQAWAMKIAYYKVLDYRKKKNHKELLFGEEQMDFYAALAADFVEKADNRLVALQGCLQKLSEDDRKLVDLRYNHGITLKSIAEKAGRSITGIYRVMARIHNQLLKCIRQTLTLEEI